MNRTTLKIDGGDILVTVLVFAAIAITVTVGLVNWGATLLKEIRSVQAKEQSFQIAEAGIDYYRWHLAQYPTDYQDGTGQPGPYNHSFYDKNGNLIGGYSLAITAPPLGSTKVTIASTGTTTGSTPATSTIQAALAEPSLAQYAVVANDYMRFGSGTVINGPVTSNRGVHFDTGSQANNVVSSALATDTDPDSGKTEWGVWTDTDPAYSKTTPAPTSTQGVFMAGRQYPVPATDFAGLLSNLNTLQSLSETSGVCAQPSCWGPSNKSGYHMVFQYSNGTTTFIMYKVTGLQSSCSSPSWSISSQSYANGSLAASTFHIPANGIIFVEDDLWVDGTINGARMTIAAGFGKSGYTPSITVNNNLLYTNTNGTDVIGLIAQQDINAGLASANNLTIDGALVAENGRVGRYYYPSYCSNSSPNSITLNGMIVTAVRYGFAYTDGTGYQIRNINYDGNLLYSPPPSFPLASTQYQLASWRQTQ